MERGDLDRLATLFRRFAEIECPGLPVYYQLCMASADTPELLTLYADTPPAQRRANLLLAAVHDVLLAGANHPLRRWYPTVNGGQPPPPDDPFPAFVDLIDAHRGEIVELLATRSTQTNEVNRSCLWHIAVPFAVADIGDRPVAVVEVGASAGLNLNFQRYRYDFADDAIHGVADSPVRLACVPRGQRPPLEGAGNPVARIGLDAAPVDVSDEREIRWLQACVWPEQLPRHERFLAAVALARADPPQLITGDAVDDLSATVETIGDDVHVVVVNSWTLTYLDGPRRDDFVNEVHRLATDRGELSWLSAEHSRCLTTFAAPPSNDTVVAMRTWRGGVERSSILATVHPHLAWMAWTAGAR